jgi:hypothetical protein
MRNETPNVAYRRSEERARTMAIAPWAAQLKDSEFTKVLLEKCAQTGHRLRTKIYVAWLDTTLRLEAKGRKLDLEPTAEGIRANFVRAERRSITQKRGFEWRPRRVTARLAWLNCLGCSDGAA